MSEPEQPPAHPPEPAEATDEMRYKGWVIVINSISHRNGDESPTQPVDGRYRLGLVTDEQPYMRSTNVGENWVVLDTGWVKSPSLVVIENRSKDTGLELGIDLDANTGRHHTEPGGGVVLTETIPAGCDARRWFPGNGPGRLVLRAKHGTAKYRITVFPD